MLLTSTILSLFVTLASAGALESRIIGGEDAPPNAYRSTVSISRIEDYAHFCAGSIIAPSWVLTAAHCFEEECPDCKAEHLVVITGRYNTYSNEGRVTPVSKLIAHSDHNFTLRANDLALLQVEKELYDFWSLLFIRTVEPISIGPIGVNLEVTVAGWGSESRNSSDNSYNLKHTSLWSSESDEFCTNSINFVCATVLDGGGACAGDCGGPVIYQNGIEDILVGIVTHWEGECAPGHTERFTRVYPFRNWIQEQITAPKLAHT